MSAGFGKLSHAYIVSAESREDGLNAARRIAAAAVCSDSSNRPCGLCRNCRKAAQGIHPDITLVERLVDDKGRQKKEIVVDQIRQLSLDAVVLPNEAEGKAYIIVDADTMNGSAQNAALKLLEEPPRGVVFVLCAANTRLLLPTVRSRCVEINCAGSDTADEQVVKLAKEFLQQVASGKAHELCRWCGKNEGMDGRKLVEFLNCAKSQIADALCARMSLPGISRTNLLRLDSLLSRCLGYTKVNVGVKHIFGLLAVSSIPETETEDK